MRDPYISVKPDGSSSATLNLTFSLVLSRLANAARVAAGVETPAFDDQRISIGTGLLFREGEQVVVGTSSAGEGDKAIIVVLTMTRAKL